MKKDPISLFVRDLVLFRTSQLKAYEKYYFFVQKYVLNSILFQAKNTEFGKKYNFSSILSIKDFQEKVPIHHYDDLKDYIKRMMFSEKNILWPEEIKYFTKSSATTGESKYIPVSKNALMKCHYKGGQDMIAFYLRSNKNTKLFSGKVLYLCGTMHKFSENEKVEVGDISAILTKRLPRYAQGFRFPPPDVSLKEDWEQKVEEISSLAIKENITGILGVPMWTAVLIKKVLEKSGKSSIFEVWPNLEVFMHGGISFVPYREIFDQIFKGRNVHYIESYNASEGYFAIQDDLSKPNEMRLMLDYGIFYEFIPVSEYEKGNFEALTLKNVSLGVNYVLVLTTNAGLFRYVIGDTVMFTSLKPPRIKITGRTKQFLNVYDEELTMEQAERAVQEVSSMLNIRVNEFTMSASVPDKYGRGFHEWVVESEFSLNKEQKRNFILELDKFLIKENGDYSGRREKDVVLSVPVVHFVNKNTFYEWMKQRGRLGGQYKIPRVSNNRENLQSVIDFSKNLHI